VPVCRSHADLLDAFLGLAGVKLRHGEPRTGAELVWAAVAGLDGLRAARDDRPELSPIALAAVRLISTHSVDVRGPRPAASDVRHGRHRRPVAATARFEASRIRAMHDLFAAIPGAAEQMPDLLAALHILSTNPDAFSALDRLDPEAGESLYAEFEKVAVELLDGWRAADAGDPGAHPEVQLVEQRFLRTLDNTAKHIERAVAESAGRPRRASA
jgi:hypothetical protein